MLRAIIFFVLFSTMQCLVAYSQQARPKVDFLVFGMYASGMTFGGHSTIYKITDSMLFVDSVDRFGGYNGRRLRFSENGMDTIKYKIASVLVPAIPARLFSTDTNTWGQPDAADQGGYYVEIKFRDTIREFQIDTAPNSVPDDLQAFTTKIREVIQKISGWK
jgi:hypothetical protein